MAGDGPEYGWLYGGKGDGPDDPAGRGPADDATRPVRRPDRRAAPPPDATRMMPTQPRPGADGSGAPPARSTRPSPPPVAPPVEPPGGGSGRGRGFPRPRFRIRYVFLVLLAWVVFLVAVPILAWTSVDKVEFAPEGDRPSDQPGTTYLLVGTDSREDLTKEQRQELSTGNPGGSRTDTIMLLHTGSGPNVLLSIPRDAEVAIPEHGTTKINAAFAFGGAKLLTETVEDLTGIRVDQYVEIGMGGVAGVVDAVGGVEICPKERMRDPLAGLNVKKGCQEADGATALAYARSRKVSALGDLDRVRRQREVVSAVGKAVLSPWTVVNPVRWWRLNNAIPDFFRFGEGMGPMRAGMWATAMTRVDGDAGMTCTVPVTGGSAQIDTERAAELFALIAEDDTGSIPKSLCTPSGIPE
jgi:LCP family protein required for cell wall assembly